MTEYAADIKVLPLKTIRKKSILPAIKTPAHPVPVIDSSKKSEQIKERQMKGKTP